MGHVDSTESTAQKCWNKSCCLSTTKPCFPLHRPAHMPVNPCFAALHQVDLQVGSRLAQNPCSSASTQHRKNSCMQQKLNLTRGQSSPERASKGSTLTILKIETNFYQASLWSLCKPRGSRAWQWALKILHTYTRSR